MPIFKRDIPPLSKVNRHTKSLKDLPVTFSDWEVKHTKYIEKLRSEYAKKSIKLLEKLERPHKGPSYYMNKEKHVIELTNVSKWFYNKLNQSFQCILSNVNLDIIEGEFVVILGESGSGKTTLLNIISGLDRASTGKTIVANHNLINLTEKELTDFRREYVSIIFQNYALTAELTIMENIDFGSSLQKNIRKQVDIDKLIQELSIEKQKNKLPRQLSGGQQQRTAIAKALAKNPKILLADEPTGAVDEKTCADILKIFWNINQKYGTTIVLITHNQILAQIANRVVKIHKGKIADVILQKPKDINSIDWKNDK